jgi:hypothetical protein
MPYDYYSRLSPRMKAIYRRSAQITQITLPDAPALAAVARELERALGQEPGRAQRQVVGSAVLDFCRLLCQQLQVGPVEIRVESRRPSSASEELFALYIREEGKPPRIQIWMHTAKKRKVVAFRTFLRTLVHELLHHLDYALLDLPDSLHTEGFFKRESSLVRQVLPAVRPAGEAKAPPPKPAARKARSGRGEGQLGLPFGERS